MTSGVDIGETSDLRGEVRLPRSGSEQTAQKTVRHVHFMNTFL